ncbi:MAG TPA: exonuclease domain-containing protein, partial [Phnomibacter sp.]|nr:exonuclease domain-containing protein [Phnomibacter sp.]
MFAIVDIETTGGSAASSAITEVAVALHDGQQVQERFCTLIDPEVPIPHYITALTGIRSSMVADAPTFADVAPRLFELLQGRIFVAHNVNFDHSFLYHQFKKADILWQPKKLCTVRYARKVLPGLPSYSLGNLCRSLGIAIEDRHRAGGDVEATVKLFEYLLAQDEGRRHLEEMTRGRNPHTYLPMNVPVETIEGLPFCPGVYYFLDKGGKVVYVGKAVNLKYRVKSHFTNNAAGRRRQEMIRNIHHIEYKPCATEMMAMVLESIEIKRLWPVYNRSQKRYEARFGLYAIEDLAGRLKLIIEKKKKNLPALHTFAQPYEGRQLVSKLAADLELSLDPVFGNYGSGNDLPADLNHRMQTLVKEIREYLPDLAYVEKGEDMTGKDLYVFYLVEKGAFAGMGFSA